MRLDDYLLKNKMSSSRSQAQNLISLGLVRIQEKADEKKISKPSFLVKKDMKVLLDDLKVYVSRGGYKLEKALEHLNLSVRGHHILDVGVSRGGFTDCVLKKGAKSVLGLDVGSFQIDKKIKEDKRVRIFENVNARYLGKYEALNPFLKKGFDLLLIDVSFISLEHVLTPCSLHLNESGSFLCLVKPQFEGPQFDPQKLKEKMKNLCDSKNLKMLDFFPSSVKGKKGVQEFFIYGKK